MKSGFCFFITVSLFLVLEVACSPKKTTNPEPAKFFHGLKYQVAEDAQNLLTCFEQDSCWVYQVGETQYSLHDLVQKNKELEGLVQELQNFELDPERRDSQVQFFRLKTRAFEKIMQGLSHNYRNTMTLQLAKKQGETLAQYIDRVAPPQSLEFSESQWQVEWKQRSLNVEGLSPQQVENAKALVRLEKQQQALHQHLNQSKDVAPPIVFVQEPKLQIQESAEHPLVVGANPRVLQIEFFDNFRCPECATLFKELHQRYQSKAQFRFYFMSPRMTPIQRMVANAHFCVRSQGEAFFLQFYKSYAGRVGPFVEDEMLNAVKQSGADLSAFDQCRFKRDYDEIVDYQLKYSQYLGLRSLPALLVNGKAYFGIVDRDQLFGALDSIQPPPKPNLWQRLKGWFSF